MLLMNSMMFSYETVINGISILSLNNSKVTSFLLSFVAIIIKWTLLSIMDNFNNSLYNVNVLPVPCFPRNTLIEEYFMDISG